MLRLSIVALAAAGSAPAGTDGRSASSGSAANPAAIDAMKLPPGYLARSALPDSLALLPPPPMSGSAAMQHDEEARDAALAVRGTLRFGRAATDAVIGFPEISDDFSCAMGFAIAKQSTPRLYALMARMMIDVGLSTYGAKNHYKRIRPFVVHKTATCYPKDEALLRRDGSYPSGHSAIGWGLALVLAELNPDRADALFRRGRDFGQSRVVCDAHWQSDVDAGRTIAAAAVARLHAAPEFQTDMAAAKKEITTIMSDRARPAPDCTAEDASFR